MFILKAISSHHFYGTTMLIQLIVLYFCTACALKVVCGRQLSRHLKLISSSRSSHLKNKIQNLELTLFPDDISLNNFNNELFHLPYTYDANSYFNKKRISKRAKFRDKSCQSVCIEKHLCVQGTVVVDGADLLSSKMSTRSNRASIQCGMSEVLCCLMGDSFDGKKEAVDGQQKETNTTETTGVGPVELECGQRYINADNSFENRISGGESTHLGEFPWIIAILRRTTDKSGRNVFIYQGGGSLLHPRVVLTAAHIVNSRIEAALVLRAGEWDMQRRNEGLKHQERIVSSIVTHNHFQRSTMANDIALLIVDDPFELTPAVNTICLPPATIRMEPNTECIAIGWGKSSFERNDRYKSTLEKLYLPIIDPSYCEQSLRSTRLGPYFRLDRSFICAGGRVGQDTCKGDGGSPLICQMPNDSKRYYQMGIVAAGIGCATSLPGLYVNVPHFTDWISGKMKLFNIYLHKSDMLQTNDFNYN